MKKVILIVCLLSLWQHTQACTTFSFSDKTGHRVFGRNFDFPVGYGHIQLNYRNMCKTAFILPPEKPLSWVSEYGSISFNQCGREFPYGGMNEAGLVIEQMWLQEAGYPQRDQRFGLSELQWIQYQLDCSASVQEVIDSDSLVRVSKQSHAPLHFLVSDATGEVVSIEYLDGKMTIHRNEQLPYPVLANCSYEHSLEYKRSLELKEDIQYNEWTVNSSGRFVKAASLIEDYSDEKEIVDYAFGILEEVAQEGGTQWSIVYDITMATIHFTSSENPAKQKIEMSQLDFSCNETPLYIDLAADISGANSFQELTLDKNLNMIDRVVAGVEFLRNSIPEGANMFPAKYAQSVHCLKESYIDSELIK
jgi:penicillin V acylase-like amidase (Ntn superfamily)